MGSTALPVPFDWGMPFSLPPAFIFFAGALLVAVCGVLRLHRAQQAVLILTPLAGLWSLAGLGHGVAWIWHVVDFELVQLRVDSLSLLFGLLFHIGALIAVIYALRVRDTLQHVAALAYAGSVLGAVFAGDLISLFFYWEGMAITSVFLIWARRTPQSGGAGLRYIVLHLLSGLLLLAGALARYQVTGDVTFDYIGVDSPGGWLVLAAFGIKCGFPLVHNWITDAYPEATPTGAVFLSMFTTKVAVYALARGFPGTDLLIMIGTLMAVFPIFYAVIENDLRRVLGYSTINQLGFMVAGIGLGTDLALNGAVAHAFNDVLFKGLLFMSMGAVLVRVGHVLGSDLGGLYRSMPFTTFFCVVGAASISAFPLFSGFVSKSLIMTAMIQQGHDWMWLGLLFASAGVFHHAGIKIPYFTFFAHDSGIRTGEAPGNMLIAMAIAAFLCIFIGSYPALLYSFLPWPVDYAPYAYTHVVAQLQLLLFSALAFAWLKLSGIYPSELRSVNLDVEWIYRRLGPGTIRAAAGALGTARQQVTSGLRAALDPFRRRLVRLGGDFPEVTSTGDAVLLASVLLTGLLFMEFFIAF